MTMPQSLSTLRIIRAICDAAVRWRNADFAPRVRVTAALRERLHYSEPMIDFALDTHFEGITEELLCGAVQRELGSLRALDEFVVIPSGGRVRAVPAGRVTILSSRTTIGVALMPALFALIAKCTVVVQDRSDELIGAFFATLIEEEPRLRDLAQAHAWNSVEGHDFSGADVVVVFGGNDTLREVAAAVDAGTTVLGFGPGVAAGLINLDFALTHSSWQTRAARDVVLYEGEGCLSMQLLFVHAATANEATLRRFAQTMHLGLEAAAIEFPPATFARERALHIANARSAIRFENLIRGEYYAEGATSAVSVSATRPPPLLPRTLAIIPFDHGNEIQSYLREWALPLTALATEAGDFEVVPWLALVPARRFTSFGELQRPRLDLPHAGRPCIADFVRFTSWE